MEILISDLDHCSSTLSSHTTDAESRRRTFWCCFCLDRLLANGRDRIATFQIKDITTRLPQHNEDFIYSRERPTLRLDQKQAGGLNEQESLFAYTIRIIDLLSQITLWLGRGGRKADPTCPWLSHMPFTVFDNALIEWEILLPRYLKYTPENTSAMIAAGHGKLWTMMLMLYFQACAYLHREYVPFIPTKEHDPALGISHFSTDPTVLADFAAGPTDGPRLLPEDCVPPRNWWRDSAVVMVKSANAISDLYRTMELRNLSASAYPIPGLGLLTAASIHAFYSLHEWESMRPFVSKASSKRYLQQDMEAFNHLGQHWSLVIHWVSSILQETTTS